MSDNQTYINIQQFMVRDLGLKSNELIIYALIHGFCQDGHSFFHGSLKYIMSQTNLSKDGVLVILQSLCKKGLIVKTDVKDITIFDSKKVAHGNQHFCLYYTTISRKSSEPAKKDTKDGSEIPTRTAEKAGRNFPPEHQNGSEFPTDTGGNFPPTGSEIPTGTGRNFRHNILTDTSTDTTTDTTSTTFAEKSAVVVEVKKAVSKYFNTNLFSNNFWTDTASLFSEETITEIEPYISFVYEFCHEKKPKSLPNYFYSTASKQYMYEQYLNSISEVEQQTDNSSRITSCTCPVCGQIHLMFEDCKECGLSWNNFNNPEKIEFQKKIYALPEEIKREIEKKFIQVSQKYSLSNGFINLSKYKEWKQETDEIIKNYIA